MNCKLRCVSAALLLLLCASPLRAAGPAEFVPQPGQFPPPNIGHYLAGELVSVDHVSRSSRIVRYRPNGIPNLKLPPEERVKSFEDR